MLIFLLGVINLCVGQEVWLQPEQIHLSYGETPSEMIITWVTFNKSEPSQVEYGQNLLTNITGNDAVTFVDGGPEHRSMFIHSVRLTGLIPGQFYMYHVGNNLGWSDLFFFRAMQEGVGWSPRITIYGDMGNSMASAMASLQKLAQQGGTDTILHIGDFAYDMDTDNAKVGDAFMNQIQPIAAYVPYMTCPGNHEQKYNFSNYKNRFSTPQDRDLYYSYDIGPAHIITISTEFLYYDTYNLTGGVELAAKQYQWLQQDLAEANKDSNRKFHPWIIVVGHRPMYCSDNDGPSEHCNNFDNNYVRTGTKDAHKYNLEDLFYKAGVDLQFYAHEHSYERLWPVYNLTVCNGSNSPYENPTAPIHIITGSAGNREGQTEFINPVHKWSAFHSDDFGYTQLHILNSTHITLEQVSIDKGGQVIDSAVIIKTQHGPNLYTCHQHRQK